MPCPFVKVLSDFDGSILRSLTGAHHQITLITKIKRITVQTKSAHHQISKSSHHHIIKLEHRHISDAIFYEFIIQFTLY
ncbi:MAG: hypothetical protein IPN86_14805 [Saprospiraceae bacterium]|nr:hypothetical protein [Saprospiraceae bacterium]